MIYCIRPEMYPKKETCIEELTYIDQNEFEWKIARIDNGFMVKFCGDEYFKDTTFNVELSTGKHFQVNNTNCMFFEDGDFETFCVVRDALKTGWTDDIWEMITDFFKERFEHSDKLIESEIPWQ